MIQVACVRVGQKYTADDVLRLRDGVARNLSLPYEFVCISDTPIKGVKCIGADPSLPGWWQKLMLFKPGVLSGEALYFDLDTIITGDLTRAVEWQGFGIISDWWTPMFNSSVMRLTGNEWHVWEKFQPRFMQFVRGDQDYITGVMPGANTFPPDWFASYKESKCFAAPPPGAMAVLFHGLPKPAQCGGWVAEVWNKELVA